MIQQFLLGVTHFVDATFYLFKKKLWHYYLWPIAVAILFYVSLFGFIKMFSSEIIDLILGDRLPQDATIYKGNFKWLSFLKLITVKGILTVLSGIIIFLLSTKLSKYIVLILLAPMFSLLSEKIDELETGKTYPFNMIQLIKDVFRGVIIALRNLTIELLLIGVFTIVGLFSGPLSILVVPILWIISAYFFGFSMMDYTCERKKLNIKESVNFVRKNRYFALGNGSMYFLLDLIPVLGMIIAPINGVVGATRGLIEIERKQQHIIK